MADKLIGTVEDVIRDTLVKDSVPVRNDVAPQVARQVAEDLAPVLVNATNSEPWYKSRIFVGLGVSAIGFIANKFGINIGDADANQIIDIVTQVVQALGLLYATYGRIVGNSKRPLGEGK